MKRFAAMFFFCALPLFSQSNSGELHLKVTDPSGLGVKTTVHIISEANQYRNTLETGDQGSLDVQRLPFGIYRLQIGQPGFATASESVEIRSSIPTDYTVQLKLSPVNESVTVGAADTLIDPDQAGAVSHLGSDLIQNRLSSVPGRSMQDLVNSQPGWLYEGNAVLHPRGSEYQTQFVVDGIPLTDNRSPSFGPGASIRRVFLPNMAGKWAAWSKSTHSRIHSRVSTDRWCFRAAALTRPALSRKESTPGARIASAPAPAAA
jgi:hypothetical protein